jgi:pyruvate dehydrogenase phosphatase
VVGGLLGDKVGLHESKWHRCDGNRVIEVLGNPLGGTDVRRLTMAMNPEILSDADDPEFYIDDTSILFCDIFRVSTS